MKKVTSVALTFVLFLAFAASIRAQTTTTVMRPAVAFVKTDRSILYIKQPDSAVQSYDLAAIITNLGVEQWNSVHQLAVIGMMPAGDRIVIGAVVDYVNQNQQEQTFQGLISIPWPITLASFTNKNIVFMLSSRNFSTNVTQFRPVGVLSADGKQWWATLSSVSDGNDSMTFYHGYTNGSGTIDSTTLAGITNPELTDGFHMSNIALDTSNNTMLAMSYDALLSPDQPINGRVILYAWRAGQGDVSGANITGLFIQLNSSSSNFALQTDSMFGLTVIPANDGTNALLGFTSSANRDNSINLYESPYFGTPTLVPTSFSLPRSIIPPSENFFSGGNCGPDTEFVTAPGLSQAGNSGDVSINSIGEKSLLFVTHEAPDACAKRDVGSAIWYYDYTSGSQSATFVYNDSSAQELQPVWVVTPYSTTTAAPVYYPGIAWEGTPTGAFGSVDTPNTAALTFTFSDTSTHNLPDTINSATITGTDASEFAITSGSAATILQPNGTESISVTFTPVAPAGSVNAMLTVFFNGQTPNMSITQPLSGTVVTPTNGVKEDAMLASAMSIDPNPFTSSASIQLTAPDAGALGIQVHDALGRTVYTSELRETGAGETESFDFDAQSLGLPGGVYFVTAFLGERQASRAVVFVR
jgi:hypothetical protein